MWAVAGVGAVLYVQGHGLHLAANSVHNVAPGPTAHLWDEVVGHVVWYLGWFLVAGALVVALADRPLPSGARGRSAAVLLAAAVGVTVATNAVGGGTVPLAVVAALAALGYGVRRPVRLRGVAALSGLVALVALPVCVALS